MAMCSPVSRQVHLTRIPLKKASVPAAHNTIPEQGQEDLLEFVKSLFPAAVFSRFIPVLFYGLFCFFLIKLEHCHDLLHRVSKRKATIL